MRVAMPPPRCVTYENFDFLLLFEINFLGEPSTSCTTTPSKRDGMRERVQKAKKVWTTSDDAGEKSVSPSEKSKTPRVANVWVNSRGGNLVQRAQVTTPSRPQEVKSLNTSLM